MAPVFFIACLFALVDLFFLRKQYPPLFARVFRLPIPGIVVFGIFIILGVLCGDSLDDILAAWLFLLGCVYVVQRVRFKVQLPPDRKDPAVVGMGLCLAVDSFGILLKWFISMLGVSLVFKVIASFVPIFPAELDQMVAFAATSLAILVFLIVRVVHRYAGLPVRLALGLTRNKQGWLKLFILPSLAGVLLSFVGYALIASRVSQPVTPFSEVLSSATSSVGLAAFLFMAVLVAPFLEEIIFRGFFFYVIDQVKGRLWAVFVIAAVFAGMHVDQYWGDWVAIAVVAGFGLVLTLFRAWTGSSIPGIIMHYFFNGLMTLIPVVTMFLSNPSYYEYQTRFFSLNFDEKRALLLKSIDEHPEFAGAYNDLAWICAEEGKELPQALKWIDQALALEPESFAYLDTKAEVLYRMGDGASAIAIAEKLVSRYPENAYAKKQLEKFTTTFRRAVPRSTPNAAGGVSPSGKGPEK